MSGELSIDKMEKVLEGKVRPRLELHGGSVQIERLEDAVLYVRLTGQCSGCPSAGLTIEKEIEATLKTVFPKLKQVVLAAGVSESMIAEARALLQKRRRSRQAEHAAILNEKEDKQ